MLHTKSPQNVGWNELPKKQHTCLIVRHAYIIVIITENRGYRECREKRNTSAIHLQTNHKSRSD